MATLQEYYDLYVNPENLKNRTQSAMLKLAAYIMIEADTVEHHARRLQWARNTMADNDKYLEEIWTAVAYNATIAASGESATDNDIEYVVAVHVNSMCASGNV